MPLQLPRNATFENLKATRSESERFLRNVIGVMRRAQKEHGPVITRMGVTGTGQAPNYRLELPGGKALLAINGANHERWPEGEPFDGPDNWSSACMALEDVEDILASLTGYKRGEPTAGR